MATAAIQKFKKIKNVTLPLLKIKQNVEYYVKFRGPMHVGKEIAEKPTVDPKTGEVKTIKREPAHVAEVVNLETGEECMIICSTVMRKELDDGYPGESYIGKCFGFVISKVEGKAYNLVSIWEVAEPEEEEVEAADEMPAVTTPVETPKKSGGKK